VLAVLAEHGGKVVARDRLRRDAGLDDLNPRSCDSALVAIRRALGPNAVVSVRRRGWRLSQEAVAVALAIVSSLG
jgi:DNA-binding winged helix-turn-helix (wHTH) protein